MPQNLFMISSTPLFYKQTVDSLIIYTMTSSRVPANFRSKVKILQIEIDNPTMMKLVKNKNYINLGLKKME